LPPGCAGVFGEGLRPEPNHMPSRLGCRAAEAIGYTYAAAAAGLRHKADFESLAVPGNLVAGALNSLTFQ